MEIPLTSHHIQGKSFGKKQVIRVEGSVLLLFDIMRARINAEIQEKRKELTCVLVYYSNASLAFYTTQGTCRKVTSGCSSLC
jgi:hypothetical protein